MPPPTAPCGGNCGRTCGCCLVAAEPDAVPGPIIAVDFVGNGNSGSCYQLTVDLADGLSDAAGNNLQMLASGLFVQQALQSRFRITANQNVADDTITSMSWTVADTDPIGLLTLPSPTFRVPAGKAGLYTMEMRATLTGAAAATRHRAQLDLTSTISQLGGSFRDSFLGEDFEHVNVGPLRLAVNDSFTFKCIQATGGPLQLNPALAVVTWLGA